MMVPPRTTHPTHEERSAQTTRTPKARRRNLHPRCNLPPDQRAAMGDQEVKSAELTRSFLSFRMLKEVLQSSNIRDDEEVRAFTCVAAVITACTWLNSDYLPLLANKFA